MVEILTPRLRLVPATLEMLRLEGGGEAFGRAVGATVPASWPPDLFDLEAVRWLIGALEADPAANGWMLYYVLLFDEGVAKLVGTAGFKGRPDAGGTVEIGYGVVAEYQRRGIASEAARALVAHAFGFPEVARVTAATFPEHVASQKVMERCGMRPLGAGPEAGTLLFGLDRSEAAVRA